MKTSRAEITLKSATLPRRKPAKTEVKLEIETKRQEPANRGTGMRFSTEMAHHVPDLRSAPIREGPIPYSPISTQVRANSLEPQAKEMIIPIARPPTYQKTPSGGSGFRGGSLSRQSTNDSDTDTTTTQAPSFASNSTLAGGASSTSSNAQPIKKSPREFIIPIAVEGGGFVTPRSGSLEPSESTTTTSTSFSKLGRPRRMGYAFYNHSKFFYILFFYLIYWFGFFSLDHFCPTKMEMRTRHSIGLIVIHRSDGIATMMNRDSIRCID